MTQMLLVGLIVPLAGTVLGASFVVFLKGELNDTIRRAFLGFAAGIMIAAAFWSLLEPAIQLSADAGEIPWLLPAIGFVLGVLFILSLDIIVPHLHIANDTAEGRPAKLKRTTMLALAVTLHNVPEGIAVGAVVSAALSAEVAVSTAGAIALAIGIAVQNIPEGAIISLPFRGEGTSRRKAFAFGALSGVVEPLAALLTILLAKIMIPILPGFLAFGAGAMLYVVVEELIPEASGSEHSNIGSIAAALGFVVMMILDVGLG